MQNWKTILKNLKLEHIKATAPGFFELSGGYKMKVKRYSDTTANGLTTCIIDFIKYSGGDANRINVQGQVRKVNGSYRWTHGSTRKGTADIHAIYKGRHISIEIKTGSDRQSEAQIKEADRITKAGGLYFVAKDMPSFMDWWNSQFIVNNKENTVNETLTDQAAEG